MLPPIGDDMAGKGDKPRPVNRKKFDANWAEIDWKKKKVAPRPKG